MKVLIVDDEPLALMRLHKMLAAENVVDIIQAKNGEQAIEKVIQFHPAVVFLDIEMPVMNGIETAEQIKKHSPESQIIFCTAYDEFAIKAFELSVRDYLLKPVSQERLKEALKKTKLGKKQQLIRFHKGADLLTVGIDDTYCFVAEEKYTYMHSVHGIDIIDESLKSLEERFPKELLRIHRNALINRTELCGIHRAKSQAFARLQSTDYQPLISRRSLSAVKDELK